MTEQRIFMNEDAILKIIDGMARMLKERLAKNGIEDPAMIGIHTGGAWVAEQLHQRLGLSQPLGLLDINFYRDDFTKSGVNPLVKPSTIDFDIENRHVILVDDVLQTGRTIRAAMNEIFDFGRPKSILLATLIERNGRQLPIEPSIVGLQPPLEKDEHIRLEGPSPLTLTVNKSKKRRTEKPTN